MGNLTAAAMVILTEYHLELMMVAYWDIQKAELMGKELVY